MNSSSSISTAGNTRTLTGHGASERAQQQQPLQRGLKLDVVAGIVSRERAWRVSSQPCRHVGMVQQQAAQDGPSSSYTGLCIKDCAPPCGREHPLHHGQLLVQRQGADLPPAWPVITIMMQP